MKGSNFAVGLLLICMAVTTAWAASTATLTGRVADANGGRIAGAQVQVTDIATNASFTARTNGEGLYVLLGLTPGVYRVTVKKNGFQTSVRLNVVLNTGDNATENFTLLAGDIKEAVTIEGRSTLIERDSPAVSTVVNRQFVENLPLNGRSFQTLLELTPGVTLVKSSPFSAGQFSVNGQRANANYFMVDGVSANFGASLTAQAFQQNAGTLPALSVLGGFNNLASVDALQEFRVQTSSYSAEFGRNPGAQISIVTRSGGNQYTWSLFNYFRNEALDAADFFDKIAGLPKRKLRQNDFGGVLGGPMRLPKKWFGPLGYDGRDKTFFFFSYEGLRLTQPQAGIFRARVPSLAGGGAVQIHSQRFPGA
jgi:carboxypeptidase family protein/TonB-dependent receptor-like protein